MTCPVPHRTAAAPEVPGGYPKQRLPASLRVTRFDMHRKPLRAASRGLETHVKTVAMRTRAAKEGEKGGPREGEP